MTITTHVAVFFACNPQEELTMQDIEIKWGMAHESARRSLQYAELKGWVVRTRKKDKTARNGWRYFYTAGPYLLKQLGTEHESNRVLDSSSEPHEQPGADLRQADR